MDEQQKRELRRALVLIKQEKWKAASEILGGLLADTTSPVLVFNQVLALYHDHQYVQALSLVVEEPTLFLKTRSDAELAVRVLLANRRYIKCRLLIAGTDPAWREKLLGLVVDSEQAAEVKYQATIQQTLRQFYHLGDGTILEQRERLNEAYELPLNEFLLGSRFVLRDPFVQPLIKSDIIETLRCIHLDAQLTYLWLDNQEYQVNPAQLVGSDELPAVKKVRQLIFDRLANQDAMRYQLANQQFDLQLMFLMPRVKEVIDDPASWAEELLVTIDGGKSTADSSAARWQKLIRTRISELAQGN
ncbi:hypothetical protein [Limosilactobacillus sp.]|jgi:hypothetical protein|uniref:hypothetical protein n=1 Tax=Limosilactobacillus sp. TaxID=2773925 RepID=UPI0025B8C587|nr:hypothetical protein [Limosilactobacillus sp.]MCH3922554.1 hypothetical protein [Limosilactobacillus sp.]MCH3927236.1 hypothetical protein [Limosilactobacillus sp.]